MKILLPLAVAVAGGLAANLAQADNRSQSVVEDEYYDDDQYNFDEEEYGEQEYENADERYDQENDIGERYPNYDFEVDPDEEGITFPTTYDDEGGYGDDMIDDDEDWSPPDDNPYGGNTGYEWPSENPEDNQNANEVIYTDIDTTEEPTYGWPSEDPEDNVDVNEVIYTDIDGEEDTTAEPTYTEPPYNPTEENTEPPYNPPEARTEAPYNPPEARTEAPYNPPEEQTEAPYNPDPIEPTKNSWDMPPSLVQRYYPGSPSLLSWDDLIDLRCPNYLNTMYKIHIEMSIDKRSGPINEYNVRQVKEAWNKFMLNVYRNFDCQDEASGALDAFESFYQKSDFVINPTGYNRDSRGYFEYQDFDFAGFEEVSGLFCRLLELMDEASKYNFESAWRDFISDVEYCAECAEGRDY